MMESQAPANEKLVYRLPFRPAPCPGWGFAHFHLLGENGQSLWGKGVDPRRGLETPRGFVPSRRMLQSLRIRNLALLDEVALDFEAGFTAVTGETGAGKSILLGGLGLLAGERADKTVIRQGADACEVEASLFFAEPNPVDVLLAELDLPPCEDGVLILKRSIAREKAPKVTVNGSLATLAALQRLGER